MHPTFAANEAHHAAAILAQVAQAVIQSRARREHSVSTCLGRCVNLSVSTCLGRCCLCCWESVCCLFACDCRPFMADLPVKRGPFPLPGNVGTLQPWQRAFCCEGLKGFHCNKKNPDPQIPKDQPQCPTPAQPDPDHMPQSLHIPRMRFGSATRYGP